LIFMLLAQGVISEASIGGDEIAALRSQ